MGRQVNSRKPQPGSLSICVLLAAALTVGTVIGSVVSISVAALVAALLAAEIDRSGRLIGTRIVRAASWLMPRSVRADFASEWIDHVLCAGEEGLGPVLVALKIATIGAPWLRLRPLAGRYLLALTFVALEVVRADTNERRRGSLISACKACVRLGALPITPLLALTTVRRLERKLPRWLFYASGLAIEWCLAWATAGTSVWIELLLTFAVTTTTLGVAAVVVLTSERIIGFAARMASPSD